jgi:hypothetical protein
MDIVQNCIGYKSSSETFRDNLASSEPDNKCIQCFNGIGTICVKATLLLKICINAIPVTGRGGL